MKKMLTITVLVIVLSMTQTSLHAQEDVSELIEEGIEFFEQKAYPDALNRFMTAREFGVDEDADRIIALYVGAIYVLQEKEKEAISEMEKYLYANPEAEAPRSFTEHMILALENARASFPIVKSISIASGVFKPMLEHIDIEYQVEARKEVIGLTKAKIQILVQKDNTVAFESEIELDKEQDLEVFEWDAKDRTGKLLEPGVYIIRMTATRNDGWIHEKETIFVTTNNTGTEVAKDLIAKSRRASLLEQNRRINYIPGKHPLEITVQPLKGTTRGFWNTVYYIFIGSIRDGVDFPVKYVCSLPYIGHAATCIIPVGGGYAAGQQIYGVDKQDYHDPIYGFDKKNYDEDKKTADRNSAGMAILGPVWGIAYAGIMSVVSWAGTDDGIVGGFNSYVNSNAFNEGYKYEYFFPNYRSLDFTNQMLDEAELARLQNEVNKRSADIAADINTRNSRLDALNLRTFMPFKRQFEERASAELNEYIEITIEEQDE